METRLTKLEEFATDTRDRLTRIETRLDHTATKADLNQGLHDVVKWIVGTAFVLGALGITIMTFVLNNAVPKAPSALPQAAQPIIITIPQPVANQAAQTPQPHGK